MKGATAKDVRRVFRDLMAHAEYVVAVYRGGAPPPRLITGLDDEGTVYLSIDSLNLAIRGETWRVVDGALTSL
jgi:hypothetical protein